MEKTVIDKARVARQFARSTPTYDQTAVVQREMAGHLVEDIARVVGDEPLPHALELWCGTGLLTDLLVGRFGIRRLILNDLVTDYAAVADRVRAQASGLKVSFLPGDMETVDFPAPQDLVASNAVLQWAADPGALVVKMMAALKPGGVLGLSTFGPSNLKEIRRLTGLSLPYFSLDAIREVLSGRGAVIEHREEVRTLSFESAHDLLRHLKQTGVNGLQAQTWSVARVREFCREYEAQFGVEGKVWLTYHPLLIVARRRG